MNYACAETTMRVPEAREPQHELGIWCASVRITFRRISKEWRMWGLDASAVGAHVAI
jgi:hypothetical protein